MEFNQIESFLSVVKHKSFSKAAKELYLTQPTISNSIQSLEKELKTTLLDRKSKYISLTDSGKTFYKYAVELINMRDQAKYNILEHKIEGEVELNASSIPEQYILPYVIKEFVKIYPDVTFSITHKDSKEIIDDILRGRLIYGIVGIKYHSRVLEYIDFCKDELVLAAPNIKKYQRIKDEAPGLDFLFSERFIFRKEGSGTRLFIKQRLLEKDINIEDLNIVSIIDSNEMIKKMIELNLGVSFVSKFSIQNEIDLKLIKPFNIKDLNLNRSFYFVYNKNRTLSPLIQVFKDFLIKNAFI